MSRTDSMRSRVLLPAAVLLIFVVRLGYGLLYPPAPAAALNVDRWGTIARNLAEGQGYVYPYHRDLSGEPLAPNCQRGPVPVFFFAGLFSLFGVSLWPVMIANWLLACGTGFLIYSIGARVLKDRSAGLLAVGLFAVYLPEAFFSTSAYSEPLFTFLFAAFHLCFLSNLRRPSIPWSAASGVLLGLCSLSQPIVILYPLVLLPVLIITLKNSTQVVRHFAAVGLAFALTLTPWTVRNYLEFGGFCPTTTLAGFNLIVENYNLERDNYTELIGGAQGPDAEVAAVTAEILAREGRSSIDLSPIEQDHARILESLRLIGRRPDRYLELCWHRCLRLWFNARYGSWTARRMVLAAGNAALLCILLLGVAIFRGRALKALWPLFIPIGYFTVVYSAIHSQIRYILPVMPYAILAASLILVAIARRLSSQTLPVPEPIGHLEGQLSPRPS